MLVETFEHNGKTVIIHTDDDPESPRDWDNMGTMVCFHQQYNLGNYEENDYRHEDFDGWNEMEAQIMKDHDPAVILPLYLFDHSGLAISTESESFRAFDSMGWDWGQVGFIFCSRKKALYEFSGEELTPEIEEKVRQNLIQEVKTYDQFLRGEVYGYIVKESEEDEESCWGFYGLDYIREEAKRVADATLPKAMPPTDNCKCAKVNPEDTLSICY